MIITVFVFGCPGSGKSTAARCIEMLARDLGETWSAIRINDYKILDEWFQADTEHARFRPREYGGFDILVPDVYDEALQVLKRQVHEHTPSRENEFIIIEFARCDYRNALESFGKDFLQDAHFLFFEAEIEICVQRIHDRVHKPIKTLDDHFTSEFVFECYRQCHKDYISSTVSILKTIYGVDEQKIRIVDNNAARSFQDLQKEMKDFVDCIMSNQVAEKHTEPLIQVYEHALNLI
jgi:adenylate kinase family enzyme